MREADFTAALRTGASAVGDSANPVAADAVRSRGNRRRSRNAIASGALAFAVGAGGGGIAYAGLDHPGHAAPVAAGESAAPSTSAAAGSGANRPPIVAVTTAGVVEVLNPVSGVATAALTQPQDAIGDEIAISPDGQTVYFAVKNGCTDDIESVPAAGGTPKVVTTGVLPALSPDGTELALVREPYSGGPERITYGCSSASPANSKAEVVVRNLAAGTEQVYPAPAGMMTYPVSHLSWAADGKSLLVSAGAAKGVQAWDLVAVNLATAQYYLPGNSSTSADYSVPVNGSYSSVPGYYYREGVYLPDGDMFVDQICCDENGSADVSSTTLLKINASGREVSQVAIGFTNQDHTSLDASQGWFLYLSGKDLFLSDGTKAFMLTSGLIAAAWVP
jgi:WD40 repeat protein